MILNYLFTHLLPTSCVLCHSPQKSDRSLCDFCLSHFVRPLQTCQICAQALPPLEKFCGRCLRQRPHYDQAISAFLYQPPLSHLISKLKFQEALYLGKIFGSLLAERCRNLPTPDYLIPVPLHPRRLRQRGFNQAQEIAKALSRALSIPLALKAVRRVSHRPAQTALRRQERLRNLRGAFEVHPKFQAQHVALIDDVMTTGSTVNEIARVLKRQGILKVEVWTLARA